MRKRFSGTIKAFDARTGSGFIERQGGPDVFVHFSATPSRAPQTLRPGQAVEFGIEWGPRGVRAVDVAVTQEAPGTGSLLPS